VRGWSLLGLLNPLNLVRARRLASAMASVDPGEELVSYPDYDFIVAAALLVHALGPRRVRFSPLARSMRIGAVVVERRRRGAVCVRDEASGRELCAGLGSVAALVRLVLVLSGRRLPKWVGPAVERAREAVWLGALVPSGWVACSSRLLNEVAELLSSGAAREVLDVLDRFVGGLARIAGNALELAQRIALGSARVKAGCLAVELLRLRNVVEKVEGFEVPLHLAAFLGLAKTLTFDDFAVVGYVESGDRREVLIGGGPALELWEALTYLLGAAEDDANCLDGVYRISTSASFDEVGKAVEEASARIAARICEERPRLPIFIPFIAERERAPALHEVLQRFEEDW